MNYIRNLELRFYTYAFLTFILLISNIILLLLTHFWTIGIAVGIVGFTIQNIVIIIGSWLILLISMRFIQLDQQTTWLDILDEINNLENFVNFANNE